MKTLRILILEDDLMTLSALLRMLALVEQDQDNENCFDFGITVMSEYTQVENLVNPMPDNYDIILLDRDCKACGSFHVLDFDKFGVDKIISISAIPKWNIEAEKRGVKKVVLKDHDYIEDFTEMVSIEIKKIVKNL